MITLWTNGTIYTGHGHFAQAFAIKDDQFYAVGSLEQVQDICRASGEPLFTYDLDGRFVCPGFNDSHMHLLSLGRSLVEVHLGAHTSSKEEMIAHLKVALAARPDLANATSDIAATKAYTKSTPWLCGRGWNQEYFQGDHSLPTRWDLDQVSTEVPIYLARACGHIAVVNSRAIELMGLTAATPQSADASYDVDEHGEPTGILRENALSWATSLIPAPTKDEIKHMLKTACQLCNQYGITSVHSDDFDMWPQVSPQMILDCYGELIEEGKLTVRVIEQCLLPTREKLDNFLASGYSTGSTICAPTEPEPDPIPADQFRIGPLKLLLDGSLGANTAYLQEEYADAPGEKGMPLYTQEELNHMVLTAHQEGMQIAMHAIGDGAVQMGLDAYAKAQAAYPRQDARHGIVHCQLTTADQLEQFKEQGIHAYIQSIFLDADAPIVEKRVSPQLAATSYQAATYLDQGISLSNGSDAPVELPHVMAGIQCAVTRRSLHTPMEAPYLPKEALSVAQAIDSFTMGGAYASFEEQLKGQILPGMLADFVVLEEDPFQVPVEQLSKIQVNTTVLGGYPVYLN
ncbi:MAG: amidohydrolase [Lachnospiraceae bacterium]|nr:amidohydrolase [Lachnospiraceae bacterium]